VKAMIEAANRIRHPLGIFQATPLG